jgi:hypothetical protein
MNAKQRRLALRSNARNLYRLVQALISKVHVSVPEEITIPVSRTVTTGTYIRIDVDDLP